MGPNRPCFELIYHDDISYEGYIGSMFTLVHKGVLLTTQGYIRDNKQGF